MKLTLTLYNSKLNPRGENLNLEWSTWIDLLLSHEVRGAPTDTDNKAALEAQKDGPAVVLAELTDNKRKNKNVIRVTAFALDIEDKSYIDIERSIEPLMPFEWILWSTHKHGSTFSGDLPRFRVLIPLQTPISASYHKEAWAALDRMCHNINDPSTKDAARLHYLPSTFDPRSAVSYHNSTGRFLSAKDLTPVKFDPALADLRQKLKYGEKGDLTEAIRALLDGTPLAPSGQRHNTRLALTMRLAALDKRIERSILDSLFSASSEAMGHDETPDAIWEMYESATKKIKETYQSQVVKEQTQGTAGPYTDIDLARIAKTNGWSPSDLSNRWVIQHGGTAWFLQPSGEYTPAIIAPDLALATSQYLKRAPIQVIELTKNGRRLRSVPEIFRECATLATTIICDLSAQRTSYDPVSNTLVEAIRPIRAIEPKFLPELDQWLQLCAGPLYSKLIDWMSCAPDLSKLLCAIYFDGAPSSGKTLFAYGMARLWTDGPPADIESVLSDFNEELCRCPFIVADEEIPKRWKSTVTTTLRSMLSTTSRTLTRKYRPTADIKGAVRLVLTANNEFLLDNKDVTSHQDLDAIAQRFLYIPVPRTASDFLETLPRETKEAWGTHGIAQHALYLQKNHVVENPGKRFWVEGDLSQMHRLLMTGSHWNSLVCEWLVRYLMNPEPFDTKGSGFIRLLDSTFFVNEQALIDGWKLYLPHTKEEPQTSKIGAALRALSSSKKRPQLRWQGDQIRYRIVDVEGLVSWSDRFNIGDPAKIRAIVKGASNGENDTTIAELYA